ncbi:MAG: XRE family transcriptional regulator [Candidatus Omnitrophota bacterium]
MFIGTRLKEIRESKKISLTALSKTSGVQLATLSRIENMKMVGTLESHMSIATALGVSLGELYSNIRTEDRKVDLQKESKDPGIFVHSDRSSYEILTAQVLNKKMMPVLLKLEPGGKTNVEQSSFGTEKFLYVLDGSLEAKIGGETYSLSKNNSLYFDASLPHSFSNKGKASTRALCMASPVSL